jgi:hypothetical protein
MRLITCFLTMTLTALGATSEPNTSIQHLMNEPMSLWDWGLFQLERDIDEHINGWFTMMDELHDWMPPEAGYLTARYELTRKGSVRVNVNALPTYIQISAEYSRSQPPAVSEGDAMALCKDVVVSVRQMLNITPDGEARPHPIGIDGLLSGYFSHEGYREQGRPDELVVAKDLNAITEVFVVIHRVPGTHDPQDSTTFTACSAPLVGGSITLE